MSTDEHIEATKTRMRAELEEIWAMEPSPRCYRCFERVPSSGLFCDTCMSTLSELIDQYFERRVRD